MGQKLGTVPPFWWGELGPHLAQCGLDRGPTPYQVPSWSIEPFGHNRQRPKTGGLCPLFGEGELGPHLTQKSPGPRPTSIPSGILINAAVWPQQIWAKNWGAAPLWGGEAGSPSYIVWPGPRPACMPSFILIHPTIWPQYTNITDRTDRQTGQRSDSMQAWCSWF